MINLELLMLTLIVSSIILILIPTFLALFLNKRISLSPKFLSIGIILSLLTYLKTPLQVFLYEVLETDTILLGVIIFVITESIVRIYVHNKYSHEKFANILSIAIGYISLKYAGIFIIQFTSFIQINILSQQDQNMLLLITEKINPGLLYLGQLFHSVYIFLYGFLLLTFLLMEHKNIKTFKWKEPLCLIINFLVLFCVSSINAFVTTKNLMVIYFYLNIFFLAIYFYIIYFVYQYCHRYKSPFRPEADILSQLK